MKYPYKTPHGTDTLTKVEFLSDKVSNDVKKANDWEWLKVRAEYILRSHPDTVSKAYVEDVKDSYSIMSGAKMEYYKKDSKLRAKMDEHALREEGLDAPALELDHYDSVSWIIEGQ
jgi:hypothetical protein